MSENPSDRVYFRCLCCGFLGTNDAQLTTPVLHCPVCFLAGCSRKLTFVQVKKEFFLELLDV